MRPVFEDSGPFWRWQCDQSACEAFDISAAEVAAERDQVRRLLEAILAEQHAAKKVLPPFVGVMGFSQGARLATTLLLHASNPSKEWAIKEIDLKFGIINSVTYPYLPLLGGTAEVDQNVTVPTIHLHGLIDPWRPESEKTLAEFFIPERSILIEYMGGHQVCYV